MLHPGDSSASPFAANSGGEGTPGTGLRVSPDAPVPNIPGAARFLYLQLITHSAPPPRHKTVILSEAPHELCATQPLIARSRRTPTMPISLMPLGAFQPPAPAPAQIIAQVGQLVTDGSRQLVPDGQLVTTVGDRREWHFAKRSGCFRVMFVCPAFPLVLLFLSPFSVPTFFPIRHTHVIDIVPEHQDHRLCKKLAPSFCVR